MPFKRRLNKLYLISLEKQTHQSRDFTMEFNDTIMQISEKLFHFALST